ncbi:MAG TPA: hypothetical protein VFH78_13225, partial [Candidatus Thermoplasmatota archaeon]|nr:hypothetical protein [Candidatus Thermoplasmatota archaeon]
MRLARGAVPLILLLAILPLPTAQASSWSVDAKVAVTSATSADYTWEIGLTTPTRLRLPMPDNATFVEARDVDGRKLDASATASEVTVTSGSKPFVLRFLLEAQRDGPFSIFPAQVASGSDSPVKVRITLPPGWSLAGYRDSDGRAPDAAGVFDGIGPAYVQYLALEPGYVDEGPAPGVAGRVVRREGVADIAATSATWSLVTTYDTDVYSRSWEVHVPTGATVTAATSAFGPLQTSRDGDVLRVTTPFPVGFGLGARTFTVNMTLPPPNPHGGTFREVNLSVRAADDDDVRIRARLASDLRYAGARVAGGAELAPLEYAGIGPVTVGVAFLPPAAPGHVQFEEGMFVVDAPAALESAARATARHASALLPQVASFVWDERDQRPFFVAYTEADVFGWEEGFYSNGLNTITIRASTLDKARDGRAHLAPVGVLVHEATHGLIDRRLPEVPHELSFLHEGLARLAETRLELTFPASEVITCDGTACTRHSARPSAQELRTFHEASRLFDVSWHASAASDGERGFLYDYSGLVLHTFETRAPAGALANALAHVNATTWTDDPARDAETLLGIFLRSTPGTSAPAFLYPGREAVELSDAQFRYCLRGLVAPPYPWEDERQPPGGCPPTGYGPADAT